MSQDPEKWIAELAAAGWERVRMNVWKAPDGRFVLGPYGAWKAMLAQKAAACADPALTSAPPRG